MRSPRSLYPVVMIMLLLLIGPSLEAETRSPELAKQCVAAMVEQKLNTFATRQASDGERFALYWCIRTCSCSWCRRGWRHPRVCSS